MNVYRIYHLLIGLCLPLHWFLVSDKKGEKNLFVSFVFTLTPLLMIDKKGEKYFGLYGLYACFPSFIHKGGVVLMFMHICFFLRIGEKEFDLFYT